MPGRPAATSRFPFIAVVTGEHHDAASRLDSDAASFRVNLGVDRDLRGTVRPGARQAAGHEVIETGFDYSSPDRVMPHPFYAPMHWKCVVNLGERSRASLADLMHAAHALARARYQAHGGSDNGEPGYLGRRP